MRWWPDNFKVTLCLNHWVSSQSHITHCNNQSGDITVFHDAESEEHSLLWPVCIPHINWTRWWWFNYQIKCSSELTVIPGKNFPARRFQGTGPMTKVSISSYGHSYCDFVEGLCMRRHAHKKVSKWFSLSLEVIWCSQSHRYIAISFLSVNISLV